MPSILLLNLCAIQTVISLTAERRPVKSDALVLDLAGKIDSDILLTSTVEAPPV